MQEDSQQSVGPWGADSWHVLKNHSKQILQGMERSTCAKAMELLYQYQLSFNQIQLRWHQGKATHVFHTVVSSVPSLCQSLVPFTRPQAAKRATTFIPPRSKGLSWKKKRSPKPSFVKHGFLKLRHT